MAAASAQTLANEFVVSFEIDEADSRRAELIMILLLQGRTGQHQVLMFFAALQDVITESGEPGRTVGVGESNALAYLLNVRRRMKIVRVRELPAQALCKQAPDRGLSCSDYAHDDKDQVAVFPANVVFETKILTAGFAWRFQAFADYRRQMYFTTEN